jgi:hypothetical protein
MIDYASDCQESWAFVICHESYTERFRFQCNYRGLQRSKLSWDVVGKHWLVANDRPEIHQRFLLGTVGLGCSLR